MDPSGKLQLRILRFATKLADYRIYRSAMEWDLTDPIVIESRKDLKSSARWQDHLEPYNHQVTNLITFCRRLPVTLLADDVGLGKTISAGLIMSELIARSRLSKTLIVAPKILGAQWQEELRTKFNIPAKVVTGRELLTDDSNEEVGAVITTYHSAREYLDRLPPNRFQMLVLDEAHKLRNLYGTEKAPRVAVQFRKALEQRRFPFVLMLTATPIQNRLWDLYSLIDLLTVARGHNNPFGSDGQFARKFIDGDRDSARHLKHEASQEFRSIVYGYMSRIRREDAKLHFPDRKVQLHRVDPTPTELALIKIVGKGIEKLNPLAQISILQALTSSPQALQAQLDNMARNETVTASFAAEVRGIVRSMTTSAKLNGLGALIETLKKENPERWRLVIFTCRRETQTTIQLFLETHGLSVGIINGGSGSRNQATIANFKANPPKCRVIVSTEAGSEGVNLQVANVLVNYDLPWNPMIVEQRIGRIQRLASEHASVGIFNITLRGTFEEYIVGRLMEKLQMATSAIGDIESLLEGSGVGGEEGDGFEEKIRQLVMAALKGADTDAATRLMEKSIAEAKANLEREENHINELLGGNEGRGYTGPSSPTLPPTQRSMSVQDLTLQAFESLGAKVTNLGDGLYLIEEDGLRETIRFHEPKNKWAHSSLYAEGTPPFSRLVQRLVTSGMHAVVDPDSDPRGQAEQMVRTWLAGFDGTVESIEVEDARLELQGRVLVRTRATVAHDSYERLVDVPCVRRNNVRFSREAVPPLPHFIEKPDSMGLDSSAIVEAASRDPALAEFARFYLERRAHEMQSAGGDERKRKKIEDDFTPRFSFTLAGAEGRVIREIRATVDYRIGEGNRLRSQLTLVPSTSTITSAPACAVCEITNKLVPVDALDECAISKTRVLTHLLTKSERSGRMARAEHIVICAKSGEHLLSDEVSRSTVSGQVIGNHLLKISGMSGLKAEAEHFGKCAFSGIDALKSELRVSEISGNVFRADAFSQSVVSSRIGHQSEFINCYETRHTIAKVEAEICSVTGHKVRPGVLQTCTETGCRALPSETATSSISGQRVLKKLLVSSSISQATFLEREAIRSNGRAFCSPSEAKECAWSSRSLHPDDIRTCCLTGLDTHFEFMASGVTHLALLQRLLDGSIRKTDAKEIWEVIAGQLTQAVGKGRSRVEAAALSPNGEYLAVSTEWKTAFGLRTRTVGFLFSPRNNTIVGTIAVGIRDSAGWHLVGL